MSIIVTCSITVEQQKYESEMIAGVIFTESHIASMTGSFAELPKDILENTIEAAAAGALENAKEKLDLLKLPYPDAPQVQEAGQHE